MRILHVKGLQIEEASLTGESVPVYKIVDTLPADTLLADRRNMAYSGTLVTSGYGEAVVCATGDRTQTGHIATLISEAADLSTPLTRKIARFSKLLLWGILAVAAATLAIGVLRGESLFEMFMAAVALAMGARWAVAGACYGGRATAVHVRTAHEHALPHRATRGGFVAAHRRGRPWRVWPRRV